MLSDTWLRKNYGKPVEKEFSKTDKDGLSARVRESGLITFIVRIYLIDGQRIKMTLGKYPSISLKEAREKALLYKNLAKDGHDPRIKRKAEALNNFSSPTVNDIFNYWYEHYAIDNKKQHHWHKRSYEMHIQKDLGDLLFEDVNRQLWISQLKKIAKKTPQIAARLKSDLKQMAVFAYDSALVDSYVALEGISKKILGITTNEGSRVFNDDDLRLFYIVLNHPKYAMTAKNKLIVELALFYGCRLGELRVTERSWLDFEKMTWTVPASQHKTGNKIKQPLVRPILPEMKHLWLEAIEESPSDIHVFTSMENRYQNGNSMMTFGSGIGLSKNMIKFYNKQILGTEERFMDKWEHWSNHDLRRTARSYWSALGDFVTVEKMLGHSMKGVHRIYDKYHYIPEMTTVYRKWWEILKALQMGDKKIVPFTPKTAEKD